MKIITISIGSKRAEIILVSEGNQRITRHLRRVSDTIWQDDPKKYGNKYVQSGNTLKWQEKGFAA
jgi:hypothetical protein